MHSLLDCLFSLCDRMVCFPGSVDQLLEAFTQLAEGHCLSAYGEGCMVLADRHLQVLPLREDKGGGEFGEVHDHFEGTRQA